MLLKKGMVRYEIIAPEEITKKWVKVIWMSKKRKLETMVKRINCMTCSLVKSVRRRLGRTLKEVVKNDLVSNNLMLIVYVCN